MSDAPVRVTVDLIQGNPYMAAALPQEARVNEPTGIIVSHAAAEALDALPAGADVAIGVVHPLTDRCCACAARIPASCWRPSTRRTPPAWPPSGSPWWPRTAGDEHAVVEHAGRAAPPRRAGDRVRPQPRGDPGAAAVDRGAARRADRPRRRHERRADERHAQLLGRLEAVKESLAHTIDDRAVVVSDDVKRLHGFVRDVVHPLPVPPVD